MTQSEATLPYAALERLLRGLLAGVESLPLRQRAAVLSGLGTADGLVTDRFPIGPLAALVDDAHRLGWDPASAEVLAFAARRT